MPDEEQRVERYVPPTKDEATKRREAEESFQVEDWRWSRREQMRDWLILGVMILVTLAWTVPVYLFEPGLR